MAANNQTKCPRLAVNTQLPTVDQPYAVVSVSGSSDSLSDLDRETVIDLIKAHGAVIFRGFPFSASAFAEFSDRFCSSYIINESTGRERVSDDGRIQTVNLGERSFPLHPELARVPWRPDIVWFCCERPSAVGGRTTICDGAAVAAAMPEALRGHLKSKRLRYAEPVTKAWCNFTFGGALQSEQELQARAAAYGLQLVRHGETWIRIYDCDFLHQTLFNQVEAYGSFLAFARHMLNVRDFPSYASGEEIPDAVVAAIDAITEPLTVPLDWQSGDVLMLDNSRFMHGREMIHDPGQRRILSQFGYANFVDDLAKRQHAEPWRMAATATNFFAPTNLRD